MTLFSTSLSDAPTRMEGKGFDSRVIHVAGSFLLDNTRFPVDQRDCVFRNAAQRRFVASMIALRPAALSLRFPLAGAGDEVAPACFLASAHLFRWAAAILARAAADILRPTVLGALPSVALGFNIWRSSAI